MNLSAGLLAASSPWVGYLTILVLAWGRPQEQGPGCLVSAHNYGHYECVDGQKSSPRPDPSDGLSEEQLLAASFPGSGVPYHTGLCLRQAVVAKSWSPRISTYGHLECVDGRS